MCNENYIFQRNYRELKNFFSKFELPGRSSLDAIFTLVNNFRCDWLEMLLPEEHEEEAARSKAAN